MRQKINGDTISEKIENVLEKLKKKNVTTLIGDAFYELKFEKGIPFYIRQTNLLRDQSMLRKDAHGKEVPVNINRFLNIADEKQMNENQLKQDALFK